MVDRREGEEEASKPVEGSPQLRRRARREAERTQRKRTRKALAVGAAAAGVAAIVTPADAATFNVTNLYDSGAGSLRQAVIDANSTPGADTITFQAGLTGGIPLFTGQLAVNDSVDIQGPGASVLSVSGNSGSRVFYLYNGSALLDVTISGLTLTFGDAGIGGGILNFENLTLDGVTVTGNNATGQGGGVWSSGGALTLVDSTISGNTATGDGGGIYVESGAVDIQRTRIVGNGTAARGGGIYLSGFGYYVLGPVTIDQSTISGNTAVGRGGGISLYSDGPLTIQNTTISGNDAALGGGLAFYSPTEPVLIENSTISGNDALGNGVVPGDGGGIFASFCADCGATFTVAHSTVASNTATGVGGGIYLYAYTLALDHTIVGDNTAPADNDVCGAGDYDASFSLIEDPGGATINDLGGNPPNQDPQLGPLANNGGPTETHLPAFGSPVVDAGDPGFTPPPATDQRGAGFPRVVNGQIDIGAVERGAAMMGTVQFSMSGYTVNENGVTATITVTRTGGSDGAISVDFATSNGTATQPADYLTAAGTLNWADGDATPKTFQVTIVDDTFVEGDETVNLTLTNPLGGAALGAPSAALLTIIEDDILPASVPTLDEWGMILLAGLLGASSLLVLRRRRDLAGPAALVVAMAAGAVATAAHSATPADPGKRPARARAKQEAVRVEQKSGRLLARLPDGSAIDLTTVEVKVKDHRAPRARQGKALPADLGALLAEPDAHVFVRPARRGRPARVVIVVGRGRAHQHANDAKAGG